LVHLVLWHHLFRSHHLDHLDHLVLRHHLFHWSQRVHLARLVLRHHLFRSPRRVHLVRRVPLVQLRRLHHWVLKVLQDLKARD